VRDKRKRTAAAAAGVAGPPTLPVPASAPLASVSGGTHVSHGAEQLQEDAGKAVAEPLLPMAMANMATAVWQDAEAANGVVETTRVHKAAPATQSQLATRPADLATADWQDAEAATGLIWTTQVQRAAGAPQDLAARPAASPAFTARAGMTSASGLLASVPGGAEEEELALPLGRMMPSAMSAAPAGCQTAGTGRPAAASYDASQSTVDHVYIAPTDLVEAADGRCICEQVNNCCCWAIELRRSFRAPGVRRYAVHSEAQMRFFRDPYPVGRRVRAWLPDGYLEGQDE